MNFEHIPSTPPTYEEWSSRRSEYDQLWLEAVGRRASSTSQHASNMKLELERCFCGGAWVACIILAAALVEIHLSHIGEWKDKKHSTLRKLNVAEEWEKLREMRNQLIHGENRKEAISRLPSEQYVNQRHKLKLEAEFAVELALRIVLSNETPA